MKDKQHFNDIFNHIKIHGKVDNDSYILNNYKAIVTDGGMIRVLNCDTFVVVLEYDDTLTFYKGDYNDFINFKF